MRKSSQVLWRHNYKLECCIQTNTIKCKSRRHFQAAQTWNIYLLNAHFGEIAWKYFAAKEGRKKEEYQRPRKQQNSACLLNCSDMSDSLLPHGLQRVSMEFSRQEVDISHSRGSSWFREWTHISCVSCIGRRILYYCTTWEAHPLN